MDRKRSIVQTLTAAALLGIALGAKADEGFDPAEDIEGSAFVGVKPTAADEAVDRARVDAALRYVECLDAEGDSWFLRPDYKECDSARDAYVAFIAAEIAGVALGCLEEGVLGAPRIEGQTCAELHRLAAIVPPGRAKEER